jgi:hypothetical protein
MIVGSWYLKFVLPLFFLLYIDTNSIAQTKLEHRKVQLLSRMKHLANASMTSFNVEIAKTHKHLSNFEYKVQSNILDEQEQVIKDASRSMHVPTPGSDLYMLKGIGYDGVHWVTKRMNSNNSQLCYYSMQSYIPISIIQEATQDGFILIDETPKSLLMPNELWLKKDKYWLIVSFYEAAGIVDGRPYPYLYSKSCLTSYYINK